MMTVAWLFSRKTNHIRHSLFEMPVHEVSPNDPSRTVCDNQIPAEGEGVTIRRHYPEVTCSRCIEQRTGSPTRGKRTPTKISRASLQKAIREFQNNGGKIRDLDDGNHPSELVRRLAEPTSKRSH